MNKIICFFILGLVLLNGFSSAYILSNDTDDQYGKDIITHEGLNNNVRLRSGNSFQLSSFLKLLLFYKVNTFESIDERIHKNHQIIIKPQYESNTNETSIFPEIDSNIIPDFFSWTDHNGFDWTTPARDQTKPEYCGSCWAFSALAALESIIEIRENNPNLNPDLSEQYLLSCLSSAGNCEGGSVEDAFFYIMDTSVAGNNCNGVILETCFPYQADDSISCSEKSEDWMDYLIPIKEWNQIDMGHDTKRVREFLKYLIMENGPVSTNLYVNDLFTIWGLLFHNPNWYFPYVDVTDNIYNHCAIIVGWQDNPRIGRGGYWICKNSWGSDWGYNGFFNIAYGSLNIGDEIQWVDYDPHSYDWS